MVTNGGTAEVDKCEESQEDSVEPVKVVDIEPELERIIFQIHF